MTWTQNKTTTRTQCWSTGYCTDVKNDVFSVNVAEFSAEREYEKETGAKMRPAIASGIVTGDAPVSYWTMFSQQQYQKSLRKDRGLWFLEPAIDEASAWSTLRRGCDRLALFSSIDTSVGFIWQELQQLGVDSLELATML